MVFASPLGILLALGELRTMSMSLSEVVSHDEDGIFLTIFSKANIKFSTIDCAEVYMLLIENKVFGDRIRHYDRISHNNSATKS